MRKLLLLVALAACADSPEVADESRTPAASGSIELSPSSSADGYSWLVIELDYSDEVAPLRKELALPMAWPEPFSVGNNFGPSGTTGDYQLRAWLASDRDEVEPAANAPRSETIVHVACLPTGWCDPVRELELVLAN
jgi:hypothetical protein